MENPSFIDEEDIPMVHQDDDYDDYNTPNASRVDDTSFIEPDTSKATSTQLRQEVKRDKLAALYRHLNVTGNPKLPDLDLFKLTKNKKKGTTIFEFYNGDRWILLTKQTSDLFAPKTVRDRFGGLKTMESVLSLDETPRTVERSFKAATKLSRELPTDLEMESIPLRELSSLVEDIDVKTQEPSQDTALDMREFLGIHKALQGIKGEFLNNMAKLTEINKHIEKDTKKLR